PLENGTPGRSWRPADGQGRGTGRPAASWAAVSTNKRPGEPPDRPASAGWRDGLGGARRSLARLYRTGPEPNVATMQVAKAGPGERAAHPVLPHVRVGDACPPADGSREILRHRAAHRPGDPLRDPLPGCGEKAAAEMGVEVIRQGWQGSRPWMTARR